MTYYVCTNCRFTWDSTNYIGDRSPPYPYCPDCNETKMLSELKEGEEALWDAGFTPSRLSRFIGGGPGSWKDKNSDPENLFP